MWFSRQHSPQVMPGNILLYDNGGARAGADPTGHRSRAWSSTASTRKREWPPRCGRRGETDYFSPIVGDIVAENANTSSMGRCWS